MAGEASGRGGAAHLDSASMSIFTLKRWILAVLAVFYLSLPWGAGFLAWGDRSGPVIYPDSFHSALYSWGFESGRNEKPRIGMDDWMYNRPFFYGLPRRLKSPEERDAYIGMARRNGSPLTQRLIQMNEAMNSGKKEGRE